MQDYDDDDLLNSEVDDILSQLRNRSAPKNETPPEKIDLNKENLEEFILEKAARTILTGSEIIEHLKDEIKAGVDAKSLGSFSELIKAFNSSMDIVLKYKLAGDKNKNQKEITQMNIDAKVTKADDDDGTPKLTFTRNDIIKLLEKKDDVVVDV